MLKLDGWKASAGDQTIWESECLGLDNEKVSFDAWTEGTCLLGPEQVSAWIWSMGK